MGFRSSFCTCALLFVVLTALQRISRNEGGVGVVTGRDLGYARGVVALSRVSWEARGQILSCLSP